MSTRAAIVAALLFAATACGSSSTSSSRPPDAAPETEPTLDSAGVPPSMCGNGFSPDGRRGCNAVLPSTPCAHGQMAIPGETTCREIAPCGDGPWGDVPIEASTQFVDASFTGTSSGSKTAPWTTIRDAVRAAEPGAIVAIAAGSYAEHVVIGALTGSSKPVRLWGRCPAMVEIVGMGPADAITILRGASGSEVRSLAIRGSQFGAQASGSTGVVFDRVWIHDTTHHGLEIHDAFGATSVALTRSLVESCQELGIHVRGADATIEATVVREVQPQSETQTLGRGIEIAHDVDQRANVTIRASVFESNHDIGVFVSGADATIEATVVRDTQPQASDRTLGRGIDVQDDGGQRGKLVLRASVIERSHDIGLFVAGSDVMIVATTVRDTQPQDSDRSDGIGIWVQCGLECSTAEIHATTVDASFAFGIGLAGTAHALVDATLVRDTKASLADALFGDGLVLVAAGGPASATLTGSRIEGSARAGLSNFGGSVDLGATTLDCNAIHLDGESFRDTPFTLADLGGNTCGCSGVAVVCKAQSNGLAPPPPIPSGP